MRALACGAFGGRVPMEDRDDALHELLSRAFLPGGGLLDAETFADVLAETRRVHLKGKEVLFARGDASDSLYVVENGRLRASGPDQSGKEMSRDLVAGELLGEMGVLSGEARSMTVYAVRDSRLAALSKSAIEGLMSRRPQLMMGVLNTLIARLRGAAPASRATGSCFALAVVPLGKGVETEGFSRRIATALEEMGPTRHLDRAAVEGRGGGDLDDWLNRQEDAHRFLVYAASLDDEEWTRRCVRQADHVLLVAGAGDEPAPGEKELALIWRDHGPTSARRSLALVHPDDAPCPSGTSRWLAGRDLHRHYHLRPGRPGDFGRIARSLADLAVGLVLGGGGARGFSQIGVIRALRENGIPIDFVGGTSMGAIIAAACAMDWDASTMIALGKEAFVESKAFREYTLPLVSLLRGRRLERVTRKIFGETQVEDLWLPQFSISCNLTAGEPLVHRRGPLWKALRASGSLPGVLSPVLDDGQLLVDGGVLDNLPGDVMRSLSGGPMIVVDVTPDRDLSPRCESVPSPWRILRSRLLSRDDLGMPGILDILTRSTTLTSARVASEVKDDADLLFRPDVRDYKMLEFEAIEELAEIGYRHALDVIERRGGAAQLLADLSQSSHSAPACA